MSIESIKARLVAATPTEWKAASGRGKLSVLGTIDENGHSYALAVFSAVPATHRKADVDLCALNNVFEVSGYGDLQEALAALEATP